MTTNDLHQFSDFFENFSSCNSRNHREIRAVIDCFEIYTINSLIAQPKQKNLNDFSPDFVVMATLLTRKFFFKVFSKFFFKMFFQRFFSNFFFFLEKMYGWIWVFICSKAIFWTFHIILSVLT